MSTAKRFTLAALAITWLASPSFLIAREFNRADGQLLRVDTSAHKIVIKTAQGSQLQCSFNGETRVVGAAANVAALPAMSHLTVLYAKDEMEFVATEIEVHQAPF